MGQSTSQTTAFFEEITFNKIVWTIKDEKGFPAPLNADGKRAQPFWSSKLRVERIIKKVKAYSIFSIHEISLNNFIEKWIPGLKKEILVGINWSGEEQRVMILSQKRYWKQSNIIFLKKNE